MNIKKKRGYQKMHINVYIKACMNLHLTQAHKILTKREMTLRYLYTSCTHNSEQYLVIMHRGRMMVVPPIITLIFSPAFLNSIPKLHKSQIITKSELQRTLNDEEREDINFILDFMIYMKSCIQKHMKELSGLIHEFMEIVNQPNELHDPENLEIYNPDGPFHGLARVNQYYDICKIVKDKIPRVKQMEKEIKEIEKSIIQDLDLVAVLEVIPN